MSPHAPLRVSLLARKLGIVSARFFSLRTVIVHAFAGYFSACTLIVNQMSSALHPLRPRAQSARWDHCHRRSSDRGLSGSCDGWRFQSLNIAFISLTESVDTSTPYGKLVFTILGAVAELERSLIAERIRNGMKKKGAKKPGPKIGPNGPSATTLWRRLRKA